MIDISIIIVSFNTAKLTLETIASIEQSYPKEIVLGRIEIIVIDNASIDNSLEVLKQYKKTSRIKLLILLANKKNIGFAKANNSALKKAKGKYILFLNPDTIMQIRTLPTLIEFMNEHTQAGAVSCRVVTGKGIMDESSHRGFPTPWNAFSHFSGLEKKFPKSRIFAGYTRGWENMETIHEVPAIVGAFMFVRREAGDSIGWWDEDYFFYGEDLDFCYRLHEKGWKIYYNPTVFIIHHGGVSSGIKEHTQHLTTADLKRKYFVQTHRFAAMRLFYKKHYLNKYPRFLTWVVFKGIATLEKRSIARISER